jgi:hypothetical protein
MGIWLTAASAATGLNIVLLLVLGSVWARNYLDIRSKHALGLLLFAVMLLVENLLSFFYYVIDPTVGAVLNEAAPFAGRAMMTVQVFELAALLVLVWITWD